MSLSSVTNVADGAVVARGLLQDQLRDAAVAWNILRDLSPLFEDGRLSIKIPNNFDVALTDWVGSTPLTADTLPSFLNKSYAFTEDTLVIDQFKRVGELITDHDAAGSAVNQIPAFIQTSLGRMAEAMESYALATMWTDAASANYNQHSGTANAFVAADIQIVGEEMDKASIPTVGRYFAMAPQEYRILKQTNAIQDASAFGSNLPVMNGVVGAFDGFIILNNNRLNSGFTLGFTADSAVKALARAVDVEADRKIEYDGEYVVIRAAYGCKATRGGALIFPGGVAASKALSSASVKGINS